MTIHHDLEIVVEAVDIYELLEVPWFGVTECIYCMISAVARRNLDGSTCNSLKPSTYEVLEGEGGEWGDEGWTHYMRMQVGGRQKIVLIKITHDGAIATGELEDLRIDEFRSAIDLLDQLDDNIMVSAHDCATWAHDIWSEETDGEVSWRSGMFTDVPGLIRVCGERAASLLPGARTDREGGVDT